MDSDVMNGADTDCASNAQSTDKNESFNEMNLRKYLMGKQPDIFLAGCECKCLKNDDEQNGNNLNIQEGVKTMISFTNMEDMMNYLTTQKNASRTNWTDKFERRSLEHINVHKITRIEELNKLAHEIHTVALEHGFWDVDDAIVKHIVKMHSELSEALQEDRMGNPMLYVDDIDVLERITDPALFDGRKPEGIAAELTDFVIMTVDLMVKLGYDVGHIHDYYYNDGEFYAKDVLKKIDTYQLIYNMHGMLSDTIKNIDKIEPTDLISKIIYIEIWLEYRGVDLWDVVRLKLDYNKNRPALHGRKY